jgi:hypothetical protein
MPGAHAAFERSAAARADQITTSSVGGHEFASFKGIGRYILR